MHVRSAAFQQIFQMFAQRFVVVATLARCFLCCFFHWPFSDTHQRAVRIRREFQTCEFSFPSAVPPLYANSPETYRATPALTLPWAHFRWHTFAYSLRLFGIRKALSCNATITAGIRTASEGNSASSFTAIGARPLLVFPPAPAMNGNSKARD